MIRNRRARRPSRTPWPASWMTKRELLVASRLHLAIVALVVLWFYLVVGQFVAPAFTDCWGYLVVQIAVVIGVLLALSRLLATNGGLSWPAHLIVVAAVYADVLANVAGFYQRYAAYDKFMYTLGPAMLAVVAVDLFAARMTQSGPGGAHSRRRSMRRGRGSSGCRSAISHRTHR
jgi:hypothetical protein